MKNHFVSQFIIKRFSNAINIFDINSGRIDESKRPDKVFYKEGIFDLETEMAFNKNIESRAANILDKKILGQPEIRITCKELFVLKRYMLISSVRTLSPSGFCKILRSFERNTEIYINIMKAFEVDYSSLPKSKSLHISDDDLYAKALKVFANANYMRDIAENKEATQEMLAWAMPFLESYVTFWDAPEGKEFILSDCGMCTEYEGFHLLTGGLDVSKMSYILNQIKNGKYEYTMLFASNQVMYENYSVFVLSSNRMLVMINPFFRLYNKYEVHNSYNNETKILDIPDIWPAVIQDKTLFDIPENEYFYNKYYQCMSDIFIYRPKVLCNEDLIYINALMLSQTESIIGFNDPIKIIDSIYYYIWFNSNINSVKSFREDDKTVLNRLIDNVVHSPFNELCKFCESHGGVNHSAFLIIFEKLISNIYKDFYENPYICRYYLSNPEETANCTQLDFLGKGKEKLKVFEDILKRIESNKKNKKSP